MPNNVETFGVRMLETVLGKPLQMPIMKRKAD